MGHRESLRIQRNGLHVLTTASLSEELRNAIAAGEGVHANLAAMKRFLQYEEIQGQGIRVFYRMYFSACTRDGADFLVTNLGAVPVIFE